MSLGSAVWIGRDGAGGISKFADLPPFISLSPHPSLSNPLTISTNRRTALLTQTLNQTFQQHLFTALYPSSTIALTIHVLAQDGSLLAACLNAATLALVDAGVPMGGFVVGCTVGIISSSSAAGGNRGNGEDQDDPLLDLNAQEEVEVPFLTVATTTSTGATTTTTQDAGSEGESDKVIVCVLETKLPLQRIEGLLAVGVDGCKRMRGILDGVVRERGARVLRGRGDGRGGEGEKEGRGEGRMM